MAQKPEKFKALYRSLKQKTFTGSYQGIWSEHGTQWDMINVDTDSTEIIQILKTIHPRANGRVWKGFTGPEDSSYYSNYRFFAKTANISSPGHYKITDVEAFKIPNNPAYTDKYGFIITMSSPTEVQ